MSQISVIVPLYKVEPYLCRCVDSILAQTFTDFELILVDDGSPDASGEICDEYVIENARIITIHKGNSGAASARNVGLDYIEACSNSEWLAFVDSDDYIHRLYLQTLFNSAIKCSSKASMCAFAATTNDATGIVEVDVERICEVELYKTEQLYIDKDINFIVPWAKLYHKSLFQDIRYPEIPVCEDEYTTYRVLFQCNSLPFIDASLYFYFQSNDSMMRTEWEPNRMLSIRGIENQFLFCRQNGYEKGAEYAARNYIEHIWFNFYEARKSYPNDAKRCRKLLQKEVIRYWKIAKLNIEKDYRFIYNAFPRTANIIMKAHLVGKKLVHVGKKC